MKDEEAQTIAENIQTLSFSILEAAIYVENISSALKILQDQLQDSSKALRTLVDNLPNEVKERLYYNTEQEQLENEKDESIVDLIRKLLKGGN